MEIIYFISYIIYNQIHIVHSTVYLVYSNSRNGATPSFFYKYSTPLSNPLRPPVKSMCKRLRRRWEQLPKTHKIAFTGAGVAYLWVRCLIKKALQHCGNYCTWWLVFTLLVNKRFNGSLHCKMKKKKTLQLNPCWLLLPKWAGKLHFCHSSGQCWKSLKSFNITWCQPCCEGKKRTIWIMMTTATISTYNVENEEEGKARTWAAMKYLMNWS